MKSFIVCIFTLCLFMVTLTLTSCQKSIDPIDEQVVEKQSEIDRVKAEEAIELEEERQKVEAEEQKVKAMTDFVSNNVLFDFDSARLNDSAKSILKDKIAWLKENSDSKIIIEGHCDERGTEEYNMALGQKRAVSALKFITNAGIVESRVAEIISYGEEKPFVTESNEAAWSKNRCVHFEIK